jgi:uncharacterized membrane protein
MRVCFSIGRQNKTIRFTKHGTQGGNGEISDEEYKQKKPSYQDDYYGNGVKDMKKILMIVMIAGLIFGSLIIASAASDAPKSIDTVIAEIRQEQNVQNNDKIDVKAVSQAKLEELGDSVMEAVIGNSAAHDRIDNRLGGDGSASLTAVHVRIGTDYLNGVPISMMSFMGSGMMGYAYSANNGSNPVIYTANAEVPYWIWIIAGAGLLILMIIAAIIIILAAKRTPYSIPDDPNMELLKIRYAKGELTHEQYKRMSENLRK